MLPVAPRTSVYTWAAPDAIKEDVRVALVPKLDILALTCKEAQLGLPPFLSVPVHECASALLKMQARCKLVSCRNELSSQAEV